MKNGILIGKNLKSNDLSTNKSNQPNILYFTYINNIYKVAHIYMPTARELISWDCFFFFQGKSPLAEIECYMCVYKYRQLGETKLYVVILQQLGTSTGK